MAYCRFSDSNWYIYWTSNHTINKNEELLAIYSRNAFSQGLESNQFKYLEVKELLENDNFILKLRVDHEDIDLVRECLTDFIADVDDHYKNKYEKRT